VIAIALSLGGAFWVAAASTSADDPARPPLAPTRAVREGRFATSPVCATCHSNSAGSDAMTDAAGRDIAPYDLWSASMMANSARDPLWRAVVSAEVDATPSRRAEIEAKCLRCHAPMAATEARLNGDPTLTARILLGDDARSQLALDGVSCALCHQIQPGDLGRDASFSGHFEVHDGRRIFGPHAEPFAMPMRNVSGFTPAEGAHIRSSALCATCHTLVTNALHADGTPVGARLVEQAPYLEWRNSAFSDEVATPGPLAASCQSCHVPTTDVDGGPISTRIARNPRGGDFPPIRPRAPFGRHVFVGGNTLVPEILRREAATLHPGASTAALEVIAIVAREQLERRTARVSIVGATRTAERVLLSVRVENLTGHKLPTAHPIRRAWLRVVVKDAAGRVVFASGAHDAAGRITGEGGAPLPSEAAGGPTEPHRARISSPDEVQVYESVMADAAGAPTFTLLRGVRYRKDNRVLPLGWDPSHADAAATAPQGVTGDADFAGGGDVVAFEVPAPEAAGPYDVEATLLYQTLGARWAAELFTHATPEVASFRRSYEAVDRAPVSLGRAGLRVR